MYKQSNTHGLQRLSMALFFTIFAATPLRTAVSNHPYTAFSDTLQESFSPQRMFAADRPHTDSQEPLSDSQEPLSDSQASLYTENLLTPGVQDDFKKIFHTLRKVLPRKNIPYPQFHNHTRQCDFLFSSKTFADYCEQIFELTKQWDTRQHTQNQPPFVNLYNTIILNKEHLWQPEITPAPHLLKLLRIPAERWHTLVNWETQMPPLKPAPSCTSAFTQVMHCLAARLLEKAWPQVDPAKEHLLPR